MEHTSVMQDSQISVEVHPSEWLPRVRLIWLGLIVIQFVVFVANMPDTYQHLMEVCDAKVDVCDWSQPTPENLDILNQYHISLETAAAYHLGIYILVSLFFWASGLLVLWHRSNEWYGLLVSYLLITIGAGGVSFVFLGGDEWTGLAGVLAAIDGFTIVPMYLALSFFFMSFPDGRIYPRWTRFAPVLIILNYGAWLAPGHWNIQFWHPAAVGLWLMFVYGSHLAIQAYRYRYFYGQEQRQQTKWLIYGFSLGLALSVVVGLATTDQYYGMLSGTVVALSYLPIGIGVTIAILRYNLWDIDVIINRTLVYGVLTGFVVAAYVIIVGGIRAVFESSENLPLSLLATAFVAVAFQPVRGRVQMGVNRLTYGDRDEPYKVISRLIRRLENTIEPDAMLPTIVETVAQALKFPYAAIALQRGAALTVAAEYGSLTHDSLVYLPLMYATQQLGELRLALRSPREALTLKDHVLLDDLARQAGVAVHAVVLNIDLQLSRQKIVSEREEARRRLGSDLHDGIGHRLAGLVRRVDLATRQVDEQDTTTHAMLVDLKGQLKGTIDEVRNLAHRLHPPELELLGLSEALQECIRQYYDTVQITLDIPTYLPRLPLAVEVATYYIIQEAITNVSRHANAKTCRILLEIVSRHIKTLCIIIEDDGVGIPQEKQVGGLGLTSMQQRVTELGGSIQFDTPSSGGTRIEVRFPY